MTHPWWKIVVVTFLVSMCVAVFAAAFSFGGSIRVVIPDRRVRSLSAIVALVAAYVAFRSRPEEAMEIVKQPIEGRLGLSGSCGP